MLYAGTEFGVFASVDHGARWVRLQGSLPTTAVRDMRIQERDLDLVAGTFGRAIWVTNIAPFAEITAATLAKPAHLFRVMPATKFKLRETYGTTIEELNGDMFFRAENPPYGATITYYLRADAGKEVTLHILDARGKEIRTLTGPGTAGMHRVQWDLKPQATEPAAGHQLAPRNERTLGEREFAEQVPEGLYTARLEAAGVQETQTIEVRRETAGGVKQGNVRK